MKQQICGCGECTEEYQHKSDCAVHNEPAMPKGECDCKTFVCERCEQELPIKEKCSPDYDVCKDCLDACEDITGYCGIECRLTGRCDESC